MRTFIHIRIDSHIRNESLHQPMHTTTSLHSKSDCCACVCVSRSEQGGVYENGPVGVDGAKCTTSVSLSLSFTITISHSMCDRKTISYHTVLILACLASNPKRMLTLGASSPRGAEAGTRSENNFSFRELTRNI